MPTTTEFNVQMEDRPGTLAELSRALADENVNIIGFQSHPSQEKGKGELHLLVDNPASAKPVLDKQGLKYRETEVAKAKLPNRPGALARVADKLGEANINIDYSYTAVESGTNDPVLIFGVKDARKAASILDEAVKAAA
jgi:hypothetical protein